MFPVGQFFGAANLDGALVLMKDQPRQGWIRVGDQPLTDLQAPIVGRA
jgi:hypothetical protein